MAFTFLSRQRTFPAKLFLLKSSAAVRARHTANHSSASRKISSRKSRAAREDTPLLRHAMLTLATSDGITAFLDRFYWQGEKYLRFKPAAAVVSMRHAGITAARDRRRAVGNLRQA